MKKLSSFLALVILVSVSTSALAAPEKKGPFRKEIKNERRDHMLQQRQENKTFRAEVKNLPPAERLAALQEHRRAQFDENRAMIQARHDQKMKELDARLAANTKLTPEQKASIKAQAQQQHQENLAFRQEQFQQTQEYVKKIASDTTLTPEQRRAALESYRQEQMKAVQDHFKAQRSENQELRGSIRQ